MPFTYRTMISVGGMPKIGAEDNMLGVRIPPHAPADIVPDNGDLVHPNTGGLSVVKNWKKLPALLIPSRLQSQHPPARGSDSYAVFRFSDQEFETGIIAPGLYLRWGRKAHGLIEPESDMPVQSFQEALAATQTTWSVSEVEG